MCIVNFFFSFGCKKKKKKEKIVRNWNIFFDTDFGLTCCINGG